MNLNRCEAFERASFCSIDSYMIMRRHARVRGYVVSAAKREPASPY